MLKRNRIAGALLLGALIQAGAMAPALAAPIAASVSTGLFHDALAPYGDWVPTERLGPVWAPARVEHGWRPYAKGRWVVTEAGWTWAGTEAWSWATDHYGRWAYEPAYGWVWVPGVEWGPAWVSWRHGGGYVGWAPLAPGVSITGGPVKLEANPDPFAFTFVPDRFLAEANLERHLVPPVHNVTCLRVTNNATTYAIAENHLVNRGVEVERIEKEAGRPVPRFRLREADTVEASGRANERGAEVAFFHLRAGLAAPAVKPARSARPLDRPIEELRRDHEREARELQEAEARERRELVKEQDGEERHAPPDQSVDELRQRHESELKAQDAHARREQEMLEARQRRERGAVAEAAGGSAPRH